MRLLPLLGISWVAACDRAPTEPDPVEPPALIFQSNNSIYSAFADGSKRSHLFTAPFWGWHYTPSVSPDGKSLVLAWEGDLWRMQIAGGGLINLTNTGHLIE